MTKKNCALALALLVAVVAIIIAARPKPVHIVAFGTSLTAQTPWTQDLATALNRCGMAASVTNVAEGAKTSRWGLETLADRVLDARPDLVLIEFAINDAYRPNGISLAESRSNTEQMIDRIRQRFPKAKIWLMTMNPVWKGYEADRPDLSLYYGQYRAIAQDKAVEYLDNFPDWQTIFAGDPSRLAETVPDGVHPTLAAHRAVTVKNLAAALAGQSCRLDNAR